MRSEGLVYIKKKCKIKHEGLELMEVGKRGGRKRESNERRDSNIHVLSCLESNDCTYDHVVAYVWVYSCHIHVHMHIHIHVSLKQED